MVRVVLAVVVLDDEVAAVDAVVVLAEALFAAAPSEVEVVQALLAYRGHLVLRHIVAHGGHIFADDGHHHLALCAVHLRAGQTLMLRE